MATTVPASTASSAGVGYRITARILTATIKGEVDEEGKCAAYTHNDSQSALESRYVLKRTL